MDAALEKAKRCSFSSGLTLAVIAGISKFWMSLLSKTKIVNADRLTRFVEQRPANQPLITVANHYACLDDPLLWSALPWRVLLKPCLLRWTMAAREIIFTRPAYDRFFSLGRCVPVDRGRGVYQEGMQRCLDVLNQGGWVHVFPEGKINLTKESIRLKWGVGRLIADCRYVPKVLPLYHLGLDDVMPNKRPHIPRIGQRATIVVGEPIELEGTINNLKSKSASPTEQRLILTELIQQKMRDLRDIAERVHNNPSVEGSGVS